MHDTLLIKCLLIKKLIHGEYQDQISLDRPQEVLIVYSLIPKFTIKTLN